jgi:hypothetical protein
MDGSRLSPEETRAAAEVHHELSPEYGDAVVASFLERTDVEIAARIDARLTDVVVAGPQSVARPDLRSTAAVASCRGGRPVSAQRRSR